MLIYYLINRKENNRPLSSQQHYKFVSIYHKTIEDLFNQQSRDHYKAEKCRQNKIKLIVIPYFVDDLATYITQQLK